MHSEHSPEPVEPQPEPEEARGKRYRKVRAEDEERGQQTDPNKTMNRDD